MLGKEDPLAGTGEATRDPGPAAANASESLPYSEQTAELSRNPETFEGQTNTDVATPEQ